MGKTEACENNRYPLSKINKLQNIKKKECGSKYWVELKLRDKGENGGGGEVLGAPLVLKGGLVKRILHNEGYPRGRNTGKPLGEVEEKAKTLNQ